MKKIFSMGLMFLILLSLTACDLFENDIDDIIDELNNPVTIDLISDVDDAILTVHPQETVERGEDVTIEASTVEFYSFSHWGEGDDIVSNDMEYTFTALTDRTLEAVYEHIGQMYEVTVSANPEEASVSFSLDSPFMPGDRVTFEAEDLEGYLFSHWLNSETDVIISEESHFVHVIEQDLHIIAIYVERAAYYDVTYQANIEDVMLEGPSETTLEAGTSITLHALLKDGFVFVHWKNMDTGAVLSNSAVYEWEVNHDMAFEAVYVVAVYHEVLIESNSYQVDLGLDNPMVLEGTSLTLEALYEPGLVFSHWEDAAGITVSDQADYTFTVESDVTLKAIYEVSDDALIAADNALASFTGDLTYIDTLMKEMMEGDALTSTITFETTESDWRNPDVLFTNQFTLTQKYLKTDNETTWFTHFNVNAYDESFDMTLIMVERLHYVDIYIDIGLLLEALETDEDIPKDVFGFTDDNTFIYLPITKDKLDEGVESITDILFDLIEDELGIEMTEMIKDTLADIILFESYLDLAFLLNHELMEAEAIIVNQIYLEAHMIFNEDLLETLFIILLDEIYTFTDTLDLDDIIMLPPREDLEDSDEYDMALMMLSMLEGYRIPIKTLPYENNILSIHLDLYDALLMLSGGEDVFNGIHSMDLTFTLENQASIDLPQTHQNAWDFGIDIIRIFTTDELIQYGERNATHQDLVIGNSYTLDQLNRYSIPFYVPLFDEHLSTITVFENNDGEKDLKYDLYYIFNGEAVFKTPVTYQSLFSHDSFPPQSQSDMDDINSLYEPATISFLMQMIEFFIESLQDEIEDELLVLPDEDLVYQDHPSIDRYPNAFIVSTHYDWSYAREINYVAPLNFDSALTYYQTYFDEYEWEVIFVEIVENQLYYFLVEKDSVEVQLTIVHDYTHIDAMHISYIIKVPQPFPDEDFVEWDEFEWLEKYPGALTYDLWSWDIITEITYITQDDIVDIHDYYIELITLNEWELIWHDLYEDSFFINVKYGYYDIGIQSLSRSLPYENTNAFMLSIYDNSPDPIPDYDLTDEPDNALDFRYNDSVHLYSEHPFTGYSIHEYAVADTTITAIRNYFVDDVFTEDNGFDTVNIIEHNVDNIQIQVNYNFDLYTVEIFKSNIYIDAYQYVVEIHSTSEGYSTDYDPELIPRMETTILLEIDEINSRLTTYTYITKSDTEGIYAYFMDDNMLTDLHFTIDYDYLNTYTGYIEASHESWALTIDIFEYRPTLYGYQITLNNLTPDPIPPSDKTDVGDATLTPRYPNALHLSSYYEEWNEIRFDHYISDAQNINDIVDYFMLTIFTEANGFSVPKLTEDGENYIITTYKEFEIIKIGIYESQYYIDAIEYYVEIKYTSKQEIDFEPYLFDPRVPKSIVIEKDRWVTDVYYEILSLNSLKTTSDYLIDILTNEEFEIVYADIYEDFGYIYSFKDDYYIDLYIDTDNLIDELCYYYIHIMYVGN